MPYQTHQQETSLKENLNGQTPAEKCGIDIQGNNKWLTLIQNASRRET